MRVLLGCSFGVWGILVGCHCICAGSGALVGVWLCSIACVGVGWGFVQGVAGRDVSGYHSKPVE
jgi:hypothetical protein